jgi:hypothetical protein
MPAARIACAQPSQARSLVPVEDGAIVGVGAGVTVGLGVAVGLEVGKGVGDAVAVALTVGDAGSAATMIVVSDAELAADSPVASIGAGCAWPGNCGSVDPLDWLSAEFDASLGSDWAGASSPAPDSSAAALLPELRDTDSVGGGAFWAAF